MASTAAGEAAPEHLIEPARGISTVARDILCLSCPVPFDVGFVNTYLLKGDPLTLVDCGCRIEFTVEDLQALLARAGVKLTDIQQLVLTHRHIDHFGLARQVQERSGCRVISSRIDGPFMAAWEDNATRSRSELKRWGHAFGIPEALFEVTEQVWRLITLAAESVRSDRLVAGGDTIEAGGRSWRVIEAPGHTEGLITLIDDHDGTYLVNDHVLSHITPNPDVYDYNPSSLRSGLPDYVASLRGLRDLPARLVLPGHGHEVGDLGRRIDEILLHHQLRADKVWGILAEPRTVFEVVRQVWPGLKDHDAHLAVREVLGHLVLLQEEGRASRVSAPGEQLRYAANGAS
ncbi:MAG: MBL fold metallo-hydrolase [Candidatus Dormibacteria bacterium]